MAHGYRTFAATALAVLLVAGLSVGAARAQVPAADFDIDAVSARSDSGALTRLDVYARVPNASLQFVASGKSFAARYELTATLYASDNKGHRKTQVAVRSWEQGVTAPSYAAAQSDRLFDRSMQSVEVRPGLYVLEVRLEDQGTRRSAVRELPVSVRDMARPIAISDVILLDAYDARHNTITPTISGVVATDAPVLRLFHEVYSNRPEKVRLTREIIRVQQSGRSLRSFFGLGKSQPKKNQIAFSKVDVTAVKQGRSQMVLEVPMSLLAAGDYWVRVRAEDENGRLIDTAEEPVTVAWSGLDQHIRDLNQAIAQLAYVAKDKDIKYIRSAPTDQERLARFRAFWNKRDPTPGTQRNERMEEYYYRVDYANRKYTDLTAGWKTDRGHVSILYGQPEFIERHPFNVDSKPYEVWYYYRIGRQFIFIDKTGFGDFQLMIPIWDERTRIR